MSSPTDSILGPRLGGGGDSSSSSGSSSEEQAKRPRGSESKGES